MKNAILAVAAAVSLYGQIPSDTKLIVDVPFAFHQNARVLPAGRYEIRNGAADTLVVINTATHAKLVSIVGNRPGASTPKGFVQFECYGESNKCFLREIAAPGTSKSLTIPRGKLEKEYARTAASRVANIAVAGE